jgi:hypothetical protein
VREEERGRERKREEERGREREEERGREIEGERGERASERDMKVKTGNQKSCLLQGQSVTNCRFIFGAFLV